MANSGNPLDIMKQLNPDNKQDDDVKSEAQKEHDKRKEEQERQRFGEYYSRRINWPIWKRIDDDKLTEEDQLNDKLCGIRSPGKLEKLDPGVYEHQKDPKDAFNILFNADRSAHPVPLSGKHADPNSPEYRIAYSKTIDFVAANEGIPIEIDLPKEKGSDDFAYGVESKYQYQKDQLKTLLSLAAEKGLPVSFSNDTKEFLKRISADEARDFYAMKRQLKINHQYNQMSLGLNDEKGLQKKCKSVR